MWTNHSFEILKELHGEKKFERLKHRKQEASATCVQNILGKNALSLASHRAVKRVNKDASKLAPTLKRYHAVGAVGYAHVSPNNVLSTCEFFKSKRCFRIRFRVSNINCRDDAGSCIREVAIKFSDQDRDGLFDLILYTGRTFMARDSRGFLEILNLNGTEKDLEQLCKKNPYVYHSLVDGLRRGPSSYSDLTYYSQICYRFSISKHDKLAVRFRLVPCSKDPEHGRADCPGESQQMSESGMLSREEQKSPWCNKRAAGDTREDTYLRQEFKRRLWEDDPISFFLEVQTRPMTADTYFDICNPQVVWDNPWSQLMLIELTTHMTSAAIKHTAFNIADSPKGLGFPKPVGPQDPFSLQKVLMSVYTEIERKAISQICDPVKGLKGENPTKTTYVVTVCTESLNEKKQVPYVEVFVTLWGSRCRSCAHNLNLDNRINPRVREKNLRVNQHEFTSESVGDLINIVVEVYYRHLTESWYLRDVEVYDREMKKLWTFPCYEVVEGSITLEPGNVRLVHKQVSEVSKKERLFQLNERQLEYSWNTEKNAPKDSSGASTVRMPGQIRNPDKWEKLPNRHRTRAVKYTGVRWEVDPRMIDFFRDFNSSMVVQRNLRTTRLTKRLQSLKSSKARASVGRAPLEVDGRSRTSSSRQSQGRPLLLRGPSVDPHMFAGRYKRGPKNTNVSEQDRDLYTERNDVSNYPETQKIKKSLQGFKFPSEADSRSINDVLSAFQVDGRLNQHIKTNMESKLPEASPGDMCRAVLSDVDFGRYFLVGSNPVVIKRCRDEIPSKFPVKDEDVRPLLDRSRRLDVEIKKGYVYMADYDILSGLPTVHLEADHRFIAAPLVLLYVKESGDLIPLAIQLEQVPSSTNPIWTPLSKPECWLLAKLWVRCCDFNHQFAISHLFNCHILMEPFLIATMRCLPTSHPCYKILMPYFRYLLVSNTMIRHQALSENSSLDKHTSLGRHGFQKLMERHWKRFSFDQLNPLKDLEKRGVTDESLLPGYLYRDDATRLYKVIHKCCSDLIKIHYPKEEDFELDVELQAWLVELSDFGFPGHQLTSPFSNSVPLIPSAPPLSPPKPQFSFGKSETSIGPYEKNNLSLSQEDLMKASTKHPIYTIVDVSSKAENGDDSGNLDADDNADDSEVAGDDEDVNIDGDSINSSHINDDEKKSDFDEVDAAIIQPQKDSVSDPFSQSLPKPAAPRVRKTPKSLKPLEILNVSNLNELAEMLATIIFTTTCQHSATHSDALDLFGFVPDVPAMMRKSPKFSSTIDMNTLTQTLPDQFSEAYYTSLLFIMNAYKPDQNVLGEMDEIYFVDSASFSVMKQMRKDMRELTMEHRARNLKCGIKYECLVPQFIPASPEPLPYIQKDVLEKVLLHLGPTLTVNGFFEQAASGAISHFVLEQCLTFQDTLGGRSSRGLLDEAVYHPFEKTRRPKSLHTVEEGYSLDEVDHIGGDDVFGAGPSASVRSNAALVKNAADRRKNFGSRGRANSGNF